MLLKLVEGMAPMWVLLCLGDTPSSMGPKCK